MAIVVEATYENGVLRPAEPLPLAERQRVEISIRTDISPILQAYGIMRWTGSAELADHFALDPELDPLEAP
jgi:predicted DNA-binding antitoxin AbrB/MazE fold protein